MKARDNEIWVRVQLANKFFDDPNKITKADKNVDFDFSSIFTILSGSTFGLILRIFIQNNFKQKIGFDIQNTSIVNFIASFFLGILVALNFINHDLLLLFYTGFLGCFSTFSFLFINYLFYIKEGIFKIIFSLY